MTAHPGATTPPLGRGRFWLAMLLCHLAAAYGFSLSLLLAAGLANLAESGLSAFEPFDWGRIAEGALLLPVVAGILAMLPALLMLPFTLLALPAALFAARRAAGPWTTMLIGGATGLVFVSLKVGLELRQADLQPSSALPTAAAMIVSGTLAGITFGWVFWRVAIRPRTGTAVPA